MCTPTGFSDRAAALAFIAAQQEDPATACSYVDTLDQGLETDLDDLDQPWMETLRVVTDAAGNLTGAVLVEWDDAADVSMGWVHGPWTTADTWQRDAGALLDAAIAQAPVARHQVYAATANTRLAELARSLGWRASATNHVLTIERTALARPDAGVRPATPDDLEAVAALHKRAFPGTYASPAELVDPASHYRTMVLAEAVGDSEGGDAVQGHAPGGILGYVAGHTDDQGGYLDFVAVDPDPPPAGDRHPADGSLGRLPVRGTPDPHRRRRRGRGPLSVRAAGLDATPGHPGLDLAEGRRAPSRQLIRSVPIGGADWSGG